MKEHKDRTALYTIVFWLSMLSIVLWVILKSLGYINTPLIIELFPIISVAFGAGAFFQMVYDMRIRLIKVERAIHHLDKRVSILEAKG